ncbi:MAG: hypothetical protein IKK21_03985 [Clostridia bacterium]|nr:hypothetical protein [Clostridia bacterium]
MRRIICWLMLLVLLPCAALSETSFTYMYLDCNPVLAYRGENIPFVLLTNSSPLIGGADNTVSLMERMCSVYFWEPWEKRYYQPLETFREGVTGHASNAATVTAFDPSTMSGHITFKHEGMQSPYGIPVCETYVVSGDQFYDGVGAMISFAVDDAMYDNSGNRIRSEKQIARNLHDWLCEHMVYDASVTAGSGNTRMSFGQILYCGTGYGGLHTGRGKCTSYAQAYQMLLRTAGIECFVLDGTANTGRTTGRHAWNIARLDGQWVFIDVTWDDNDRGYDHDYFAVSRAHMDRNHTLDSEDAAFVRYLTDGRFDRAVRVLGK